MKTSALSLVLLTAFSNAVETTSEQFSSELEQIKINLSQIENQAAVEAKDIGYYAATCGP
jgi:hypothetical protein